MIEGLKRFNYLRARYFDQSKNEIALKNVRSVRRICLGAFFVYLIMLCLTPIVFKEWEFTREYLWIIPSLLGCYTLAEIWLRVGKKKIFYAVVICMLTYIALFFSMLMIDVFSSPLSTATYMPFVFMILPVIFILPIKWHVILSLIMEIIYVYFVVTVKNPRAITNDLIDSFAGLGFAFVMTWLVMRIRVEDNHEKVIIKELGAIDSLTGIRNRGDCEKAIKKYFEKRTPGELCAMILLDIDNFKRINDTVGHLEGDEVLRQTGQILMNTYSADDIFGRIGGDEFLILMHGIKDRSLVEKSCSNANLAMKRIHVCEGITASCSMGAYMITGETPSYEEAFARTDKALYAAKNGGRDRYVIYNDAL